ncbi:ABC transporter substrate-binding protein, partial [Chloroflexota bacterium]
AGTSATLERNPDYWMDDPMVPDLHNQLPYLDGFKVLIIPDSSTRLAGIRTGKLDHLGSPLTTLDWSDAISLIRTSPDLKYSGTISTNNAIGIALRIFDRPEKPWYDIRVRRAMNMAIDRETIAQEYYQGLAETYYAPIPPYTNYKNYFTPLEELPQEVRELYEYHPDKAKQIMVEAGYPDGFKASVICINTQVDWLSIIKAQWAEIGIDLELDVREFGAWTAIHSKRSLEEMIDDSCTANVPSLMLKVQPDNRWNMAIIDDPKINQAFQEVSASYFDPPKKDKILKEIWQYIQALVLDVPIVVPKTYTFWQPWVMNYTGEIGQCYTTNLDYPRNIWVDQDLKQEMTGRR